MSSDEQVFQTLVQLGLSVLEARIYFSLCNRQPLTAKEISRTTNIAQPDTYRVLDKIRRKGLIEKSIEVPSRFKAVPLDTGIAFLVSRRKIEHDKLVEKSELVIQSVKQNPVEERPLENIEPQFSMIPQRELVTKRINEAINRSENTVDIYLSWKRLVGGLTNVFNQNAKSAWERGVHFRIVVESPEGEAAQKEARKFCNLSPFCAIRFLPGKPRTVTGIYDTKEVFIILNPEEGLFDSPALWSNNMSLVTAIQEYFELLWLISMKCPDKAQTSETHEKETL
jgi:sugar-specific transcriptional regulator TrmB